MVSSMNISLILAVWRHGKLCGNHRNYAAVGPQDSNRHKSLMAYEKKVFVEKLFFQCTVSILGVM